ncbi:MotA/TolQ/ExbB proton channel family protein [Halomonas sp. McH1-25]|uniref:MotA/TolQ/ExbB proton channel family protein n=1 Tax=unclassified Halomonas TaxID=2609666 RepID=UPI001EF717EF|nr:MULTISPECIES: MotA/TolQ/ExbB proton channel family protein [unclassified Halomonas]MCG7598164.1 MotA/TolQ/ExbB proton channel family protein [Halomonas sp. McH1-25]MCP1344781.1 MotA/TolQ/ExbB proton channel family protein [Halomonas sp. FL8]MCP1363509.1 MotA/TolQ/ExbB proton channel family protein [Halomonas sp. BBD45]MCP1366594.1 MotA/TolQ/ExbB proton channel family protein [Halomonas sp. BBD48]
MKVRLLLTLGVLFWVPLAFAQSGDGESGAEDVRQSSDQLLETLRADRQAAETRDRQRLEALLNDQQALDTALSEARESLAQARERQETLETRQSEQQARLAELRERRGEEAGDLESVYDVARRHASDLRNALDASWLTVGGQAALPERLDDEGLLDVATLASLGDSLISLTLESGRGIEITAPVADAAGNVSSREVVRLGDYLGFSNGQLLQVPSGSGPLSVAEHTPSYVSELLEAYQAGNGDVVAFDPTRGAVLDALAQQPTLWERFQQGGAVGYVVVALGVLGLIIALAQYAYLLLVTVRMRRQLREPSALRQDNPLGRVLSRFNALGEGHAPEALEARLDEALLAEQPRLERGQPLVKLLAAVAPLLGLLGTVTGMIVTFQSITVFGTGDPQLMAGGISQALVTTVLGLITAVPLLFAQTALASRSRNLIGTLEGRASAVLAEHLESRPTEVSERRHATFA